MSDIIRLLPDSVANQIAAGEVIQRPASVVKELVENAIDAGATHIDVVVADAGKTSIQVIDDGKGMSETDARLAFERHATSKIREASDLFALSTMGFRGEALASIAAVAQVELRTRQASEELGTSILVAGSKVESQEPISCAKGSNFSVKNLFYNVPARRKFLKSNQTELSNILSEFERIALVNPEVGLTLRHNDSEVYHLSSSQLRQRIIGIFGKKINQELLSLQVDTTMIRISGFVGKPESARKKGARQFLFVNGRYMRHPYFHKAVMEAYDHLIAPGEQVSYFIYFEVDPANIDVNIHPTKTEIKFENEQAIWQIIAAVVKETLGKFNAVPSIDFDTEGMPDIPVFIPSPSTDFDVAHIPSSGAYNPFDSSPAVSPSSYAPKSTSGWEAFYREDTRSTVSASITPDFDDNGDYFVESGNAQQGYLDPNFMDTGDSRQEATLYQQMDEPIKEASAQHYQFKGRFILTSVKSGLMLIDQQRAHIRILYDKYLQQIVSRQGITQGVLFPDIIQFPPSEVHVLQDLLEDLSFLGFDLTDFGGGSYAIQGVPAGIEGLNPQELIQNMVHTAIEKGCKVKEELQSSLALTLAKAAAIVPGQVLTNAEMNELVDQLFCVATPNYTPDGKTVLSVMKEEDIERLFK
ncbi:MAG: DNA mismatch repair endonuclease MutL [Phocaeicola sp.]